MPDRVLRAGILTSDSVNSLTWPGEIFYRRLMSIVDDYGRYDGRPEILLGQLYSLKLGTVSRRDVEGWIRETETAGLIKTYTVNGKPYLEMVRFDQRLRAKKSKWPSPAGELPSPAVICQHPHADADKCVGDGIGDGGAAGVGIEKPKIKPPPPTMSAPAINDRPSTIDAEWAVVVVDLEELGMDNPEGVCRASDWSPATAKALVDHFINHREAEGWGVGLLRSKLLGPSSRLPPEQILTLQRSGKPVASAHGDPHDPLSLWLAMDSASQDRWRMGLLARHRRAIEGLGPEGRMSLLPGENLRAIRQMLAASEPRWLAAGDAVVRMLMELERRGRSSAATDQRPSAAVPRITDKT